MVCSGALKVDAGAWISRRVLEALEALPVVLVDGGAFMEAALAVRVDDVVTTD